MANKSEIQQDNFEKLLAWLDRDREIAGQKYESIRAYLIRIFLARGCQAAEELTDETIDRVAGKIDHLIETYKGDPALYFYAVAKNVAFETFRQKPLAELPANLAQPENNSAEPSTYSRCLEYCLSKLTAEKRQFILDYYQGEKADKLNRRRHMADRLGISNLALRNRALRLRTNLQECVLDCSRQTSSETFSARTAFTN